MTNFWQGKTVRLRAVELEDWKYFFESDKDLEFSRFTDEILFPDSAERVKKWVSELAASDPWKHEFRMMIENLDGECVGTINSHTCNSRAGTFQYGISIKQEHRQRGYAAEARLNSIENLVFKRKAGFVGWSIRTDDFMMNSF